MSKSITINNLKGIKQFTFIFPDKKGVYLLVGPNGIGKTTLLTCIDRICNPLAFARGFYQPKNIRGYDEYSNSEVRFDVENTCVVFRKTNSRWAARPRRDSQVLLKQFGFTSSIFIKADSKRIDATQDEIDSGRIVAHNSEIITTLNKIFETDKYNKLKKLKVTHGKGRSASFFNIIKDGSHYYTEKRFSTGEIAILRLIDNINNAMDNSIILLDEAEMALHPRVQVNLLKYLTLKAEEKNITVFISTHSPTMIKATDSKNILLLDSKPSGEIKVRTPCYPAMAIGGIDFEESKIFDYIFFVEDDMARSFLKKIINRYFRLNTNHATAYTTIIPVGGFYQTSKMAVQTNDQLFQQSKVFALVDTDAFENIESKPEFKALCDDYFKKIIFDLTITPELKFIEILNSNNEDLKRTFRDIMNREIISVLESQEYQNCNNENQRHLAKKQFSVFINKCASSSGDSKEIVTDKLINMIVDTFSNGEIQGILGPIFNQH